MQHSPMACIRKAAIFKNLPNEMLEKLVPISTHQEYFPKGSIIRQPGDGKNGMLLWIKAVPRFTISTKTVKRPY